MLALPELQRAFGAAILTGDAGALADAIEGDGLPAAARLQIYRNHVLDSLTEVLKATYPVICRLVDERFFGYAADRYIRSHPPSGPCLFEYGETFPSFLEGFPPCRDLAYLPDVARLEWAASVALHADDLPALAVAALGEIPAVRLPGLRLRLHPSLSLHASPWPVDLIWRANQPDREPAGIVDLGAGSACLEVRRSGDDVVLRRLDAAAFTLRRALLEGGSLGDAAAASAVDSGVDFGAALFELFGEGMVVGFESSTSTQETT